MGHLLTQEVPLSVSYHFAFSYCSWGSQGKNTEVFCHSLLHWTNLDSIFIKKQRHYFVKKVCLVKAMVFPVVMYGCESWTIKKAECGRIDAFELWCWRRLLRAPWTARRYNQSILKRSLLAVHWKDWYWGWNSNTLAIWCEELTHLKRPWCWGKLRAGGEGDNKRWNGWMALLTQLTWGWGLSKLQEIVKDRKA